MDIEHCRSYYVGSTLFIDCMPYHPNIALNLNGRGFFFGENVPNIKFVVSNDIKELVNEIYKSYKDPKPQCTLTHNA